MHAIGLKDFWVAPHQEAFLNKLEVVIQKEKTIEVQVTAGWYTEHEMSCDLKWNPSKSQPLLMCLSDIRMQLSFPMFSQLLYPIIFRGHGLLGLRKSVNNGQKNSSGLEH